MYAHARRMIGTLASVCALVLIFTGCTDISKYTGGVSESLRESRESLAEGRPTPAPALAIANPPRQETDNPIKPVEFVTLREPTQPVSLAAPQPPTHAQALRVLYDRANQRYAMMDSYIYRMKRREVVGTAKQPEELILVRFRKNPYSVYLKWLGTEGKGREVVYVRGKHDNKMHVLMAPNDLFKFSPGGMRMPISPDDPLAKARSRYPITESGLGHIIDRFGRVVAAAEKGDPREGKVAYLGRLKRPEFEQQVEAVHQVLPEKLETLLPKGGQRWYYFDATSGLPVLMITHDPSGEVEYYCHDHIQHPVRLDDDDFNPDRLGKR